MKPLAISLASFATVLVLVLGCGTAQTQGAGAQSSPEVHAVQEQHTVASGLTPSDGAQEEPLEELPEASGERASGSPPVSADAGSGATSLQGSSVSQQDEPSAADCHASDGELSLVVDRKASSLEDGRIRVWMDGPICQITLSLYLKDGGPAVEEVYRYAGVERDLRWDPVPRDEIEQIEVRISADDGAYQSVLLVPWSVTIDHEEVEFDTNQAVIRSSEVASLEDSFAKIEEVLATVEGKGLGRITLFIAGHTDTRGSAAHNLTLSRQRARAIAVWFVDRGLCIPIAAEGFGETALKKMTADEVGEPLNRRVDYILSIEPPMTRRGATPAWRYVSNGCAGGDGSAAAP